MNKVVFNFCWQMNGTLFLSDLNVNSKVQQMFVKRVSLVFFGSEYFLFKVAAHFIY